MDPAIRQTMETLRSMFPWGSALLQHMTTQGIDTVTMLCNGKFNGAVATSATLLGIMSEESGSPEVRQAVISEFEAMFREVALTLKVKTPK